MNPDLTLKQNADAGSTCTTKGLLKARWKNENLVPTCGLNIPWDPDQTLEKNEDLYSWS